jgi:murein DD-endopeptidase MepM/ murein hydrolase activator NlpD
VAFTAYIDDCLSETGSKFGIGGYGEHRSFYGKMALFAGEEPRTVHLGTDIWGPAGTRVYAPLGGTVHSFAYNNGPSNYGATIILQHQLDTVVFYTLYGHMSKNDLVPLKERNYIIRGDVIGHFGTSGENGNWPPHLHFQVISDLRLHKGDYPGVCRESEREKYLALCPDPELLLNLGKYPV